MGNSVSYADIDADGNIKRRDKDDSAATMMYPRWIEFYVGTLGWIAYLWDAAMIFIFIFMLLGMFPDNATPWTLIALMITQLVVYILFALLNQFYFVPYYRALPRGSYMDTTDGDLVIIVKDSRNKYAKAIARDLCYHNDASHFQPVIWKTLFVLVFYGVFLRNGTCNAYVGVPGGTYCAAANHLPAVYEATATENLVIQRLFYAAVISIAGMAFNDLCTGSSTADFLRRHFTAQSGQHASEHGGKQYELESRVRGTQARRYAGGLL